MVVEKKCWADINLFRRVAFQRYEEAKILSRVDGMGTGAVYLAGYSVECVLKALLLSTYPAGQCRKVLESFRGRAGHDFESLIAKYRKRPSASYFPPVIIEKFILVNSWNTDLRYEPSVTPPGEAKRFVEAVETILAWSKERL